MQIEPHTYASEFETMEIKLDINAYFRGIVIEYGKRAIKVNALDFDEIPDSETSIVT